MARRASADDDRDICAGLPEVPFFTIDHVDSFNAVLVQQLRLREIDRDELAEILTEAWAAKTPNTLARKSFDHG